MSTAEEQAIKGVSNKLVMDSLANFASGLGVPGKDKRKSSRFITGNDLNYDEIENLYRDDWIAGKIIDIIPDEMTREWISFSDALLTNEQREEIKNVDTKLQIRNKVNLSKRWGRLYGGCLTIINVEDGLDDPSLPLELDKVTPGSLKSLTIADRRFVSPHDINTSRPLESNFLMPDNYRLSNSMQPIHHSRVLRFDGTPLPQSIFQRNQYWGDPIYKRIYDALVNANISVDSAAGLLFESNVDVVSTQGLLHNLVSDEATKQLVDRFVMAKYLKSNYNFTVIDKELESLTKLSNNFSGIPDLIDKFLIIISAAADVPATRLFGTAPIGMNATGEGDLTNYYDMVSAKQEFELRPQLEYLYQIVGLDLGIDPNLMKFIFNPLWQLSETEKATVKQQSSAADTAYIDLGVLRPSMVARQLKMDNTYTVITDEWIAELEAAEKEADNFEKEEIERKENEENEEVDINGDPIDGEANNRAAEVQEAEEDSETDETE